jgi:hypothetical protein
MTVSIDTSSIQITVHADGVKPRVRIVNRPLVLGASSFSGSAQFELSHTKATVNLGEAFQADARARFSMGPGDTLDDWKVGFVQLVRQPVSTTSYAGRTQFEGSIVCDAVPGFSSKVALDSVVKAEIPWYVPPDDKFKFKGSVATPQAGDAPSASVPLFISNHAASNVDNYLFAYSQDTEFWTILTAIGPDQSRQYLAHFHWRVVYRASFFG